MIRAGTLVDRRALLSVLSELAHLGHGGLVLIESVEEASIDGPMPEAWQAIVIGERSAARHRSR